MNLQNIYTVFLTADLAAAEGWYTKLLGRGPDYRPMDTLFVQWELFVNIFPGLKDGDFQGRLTPPFRVLGSRRIAPTPPTAVFRPVECSPPH